MAFRRENETGARAEGSKPSPAPFVPLRPRPAPLPRFAGCAYVGGGALEAVLVVEAAHLFKPIHSSRAAGESENDRLSLGFLNKLPLFLVPKSPSPGPFPRLPRKQAKISAA